MTFDSKKFNDDLKKDKEMYKELINDPAKILSRYGLILTSEQESSIKEQVKEVDMPNFEAADIKEIYVPIPIALS